MVTPTGKSNTACVYGKKHVSDVVKPIYNSVIFHHQTVLRTHDSGYLDDITGANVLSVL